jgi:hypothetical protein
MLVWEKRLQGIFGKVSRWKKEAWGIPCDGDPEKPKEPENICEQVQQLQTNALFMQKMGTLKNAADNFNYEIGYEITPNTEGTLRYEFAQGNPRSGTLDGLVVVNQPLDGIIHSHYSGQNTLSIFPWTIFLHWKQWCSKGMR